MRDHSPIVINEFLGTFDRGEEESTPIGYFLDSLNIRFLRKGGVATRYGTTETIDLSSVVRMAVYKRIGEAQRLLLLTSSGDLFDSVLSLVTPILSIATMTDFSVASIFDRAYITPHNGVTGLSGEKVYVYTGAGVARAAAGAAPSAFTLTVVDGASGHLEAGTRVFAIAYETATGYLTKPGGYVAHTSAGDLEVDVSGIQVGPPFTAARVLLATKRIVDFDGNFQNQTYYFVPNGRVGDNTTTTLANVSFYDADLQADATYLLEQLEEIPAGAAIKHFNGRLIVGGENAAPAIGRVSEPGSPESFNEADGYVTVNPGDSGAGIKNIAEYRGQILWFKSQRTYATTPTNLPVAAWNCDEISSSVGTEPHGIGRSLDFGDNIEERIIIADRVGLRMFTGAFNVEGILTMDVDDIWARINEPYFKTIEVALDPIEQRIYVAIPLDSATSPNAILFGDYSEAGEAQGIKWTLWRFPFDPTSIVVDVVSNSTVFRIGSNDGDVYKLDEGATNDDGQAIENYVEFPLLPPFDAEETVNHFTGIKLRARGSGSLGISCRSLDSALALNAQSLTLQNGPGVILQRLFNFTSEHCAVKLRLAVINTYFTLTKFILYVAPVNEERYNG
jgi:hypothetical protein